VLRQFRLRNKMLLVFLCLAATAGARPKKARFLAPVFYMKKIARNNNIPK
jgi:hypothetical protein